VGGKEGKRRWGSTHLGLEMPTKGGKREEGNEARVKNMKRGLPERYFG